MYNILQYLSSFKLHNWGHTNVLTCSDIKADKKNMALAMPPAILRVSDTNHSPSNIQGTGVIPIPKKNI